MRPRIEAARIAVERGLDQATARAYALAGATDPLSQPITSLEPPSRPSRFAPIAR